MTKDYKVALGFTEQWFSLGLITEEDLAEAAAFYETGADTNAEHYRYGAFLGYVQENRPLPEAAAAALYSLGAIDPDPVMGQAMMADILDLPECPIHLLEIASNSGIPHLVRKVARNRLIFDLKTSALTKALFGRCLASGDGVVHRYLIEEVSLTSEQIQALAAQGANKAVRNLAGVKLKQKNYEKRED